MIDNCSQENCSKRPMLLGLGGSGAAVIANLAAMPAVAEYYLALIDTDSAVMEKSPASLKINAVSDWGLANGAGCGGDIIRGERSIARERARISGLLENASFLTVVGGLGGGTASGGIRTIVSVAHQLKLPCICLLTTPFSFESYSRQHNAEEAVRELLPVADVLLTIPNDLLFAALPPDTPAAVAFERSAGEIAHTAFGIAELMRCKNMIGADFAAFMNPLKNQKCTCRVGIGAAENSDGLDRCAIALERLLQCPFLGGLEHLKKSDAVYFVLSGGNDLQLAEMKRSLEMIPSMLPDHVEVYSGAAVAEQMTGHIQLTAVAVQYENPPQKKTRRRKVAMQPDMDLPLNNADGQDHAGNMALMQDEFTLTCFSRGIFSNLPPTKYQNEDLDVPTFQRKNVVIDRGKTRS